MIYNEKTLLDGNAFQYEARLTNQVGRFIANGSLLTTYYNISENDTTVDRGIQDIDSLFGRSSPIRYNQINNFPINGFSLINPNNNDELQIEDIHVEGDIILQPSTIMPSVNDFFTINSMKIVALFKIIEIFEDSMRPNGYFKCRYKLQSNSDEILHDLKRRVIGEFETELSAVGTTLNPIFRQDDFILRGQIMRMKAKIIQSYKGLFYDSRHNAFLYQDHTNNRRLFDLVGNQFAAKHNVFNIANSVDSIILHDKLYEPRMNLLYINSIFNWIEIDAPLRFLNRFSYRLENVMKYTESSFYLWTERDIHVIIPNKNNDPHRMEIGSYFNGEQLNSLMDPESKLVNEYEQLIHKFIHQPQTLSIQDISLHLADSLLVNSDELIIYQLTPIILFIINKIMDFN